MIQSLDKCYLYKYCLSEERYFPLLDEFISEIIVFCVLDIEINIFYVLLIGVGDWLCAFILSIYEKSINLYEMENILTDCK